ncbi:hypothetical protein AGMMS49949_01840 [Alphaproteobacteria bacterium]|nr:hypothetical protein AGMMS49949_01840 [Alphaproteobacteria bacterium]GHS95749.1 hypothetical protein AGMMS50296_0800 [Alphaproteobacteria bacterium]
MRSFSFLRGTFPVTSRQNRRSLSVVFSVLVFLLAFMAACTFLFSQGFQKWGHSGVCKMTVEIPRNLQNPNPQFQNQKVQRAMEELKKMGALGIEPVPAERLRSILKMWTGDAAEGTNASFPFPTLLDINFDPQKVPTLEQIRSQLRSISPDISIENHSVWGQKLLFFGKSLKAVTFILGGVILFCAALIVILVTKSALQAYYTSLDILRLLGAQNSYIARIFQYQIFRASFWGGVYGVLIAGPTVYVFMLILKYLGLEGLAWNALLGQVLGVMACVPLFVLLMSFLVSRLTVFFHLRALNWA